MDEESDGQLVRRIARSGGTHEARDAESELCRRFAPRIRVYGLRHLRSEESARDLVQSVLLAVIVAARAGRVEEPDQLARFVLGTCRNIALRQRSIEMRTEPAEPNHFELVESAPAPEMIDTGALVRCLAALDVRARTVLYMSYNDGKTSGEIAAQLGTTPANVRVLRHRAITQVRRCLDSTRAAEPTRKGES